MTRLTPKAEELVQAGREALRPSEADRARVFQALLPRLGDGLGAEGLERAFDCTSSCKRNRREGCRGDRRDRRRGRRAVPRAAHGVAAGKACHDGAGTLGCVPPAPIEKVPESAPSAVPRAEAAEERAPVAPRPADSLAEEVAILSQASAALHGGRPAAALKALDEHRRKFPRGALVQERTSARIQALCALGRMKEAQAELARLARTSPNSPHVARARKACQWAQPKSSVNTMSPRRDALDITNASMVFAPNAPRAP